MVSRRQLLILLLDLLLLSLLFAPNPSIHPHLQGFHHLCSVRSTGLDSFSNNINSSSRQSQLASINSLLLIPQVILLYSTLPRFNSIHPQRSNPSQTRPMAPLLSSAEINLLIYHYLSDSGFNHSAFSLRHEASLDDNPITKSAVVPPGQLVAFLTKGLLYRAVEEHVRPVSRHRNGRPR